MGTNSNTFRLFPLVASILLLISGLFVPSPAQVKALINGQPTLKGLDTGIHPDSPTRTKLDLSGEWSYSLDGEVWQQIRVPSSLEYEDRIVFRRRVTITDTLLSNFSFKFVALGINYEAEVSVNEVFIGRHVGGYTSFEFDIPDDALQLGQENTVTVIVNNRLTGRTTLPLRQQVWGWKNFAGILRDVYLVAVPRTWVDKVTARPSVNEETGQGTVALQAVLTHKAPRGAKNDTSISTLSVPVSLNLDLIDRSSGAVAATIASAPAVLEANKNLAVDITLTAAAVKLWSPEVPDLYLLRVSLVTGDARTRRIVDQTFVNVGFSSIHMDGAGVMVNGRRTLLKGVVWHEDSPRTGASLTYAEMEKDVALLRSLGVNAVRVAFHPPHPYFLNLCSRNGLFVLEEIPAWNVPAEVLGEEAFQALAENQVREMVERDAASPAVLAWGLGSSLASADDRAAGFVRRLRDVVRTLDRRPVYAGTSLVSNDRSASEADIAALLLPTQDLKTFKRQLTQWKSAHPKQPVLLLGYGKEVDHRNHNGYSDPLSQEAQARFFLQYYGAIKEAGIAGSFVSSFADWRGDRPVLTVPVADRTVYPTGLVSVQREKRLAFEMVRILYNEEKISALPAGTYRTSFPIAHVLTGLFVIILIGYQYGYSRRFSESLQRSLMRSYNFFADLRDLRTVASVHTLILAGSISLTMAVLVSAFLYHFRTDRMFDYVVTFLLTSDTLKDRLIWVTWNPFGGILVMTLIFFLSGVLLALALKIVALVIKARATWFHVYSVAVWGGAPMIFLSPIAMSLFKIIENPAYVLPAVVLISLFVGWTFFRVLKGMSVVFDVSAVRTYIGGSVVMLLACGGLVLYYDATYALGSTIAFVVHLVQNLG